MMMANVETISKKAKNVVLAGAVQPCEAKCLL